MFGKCPGAANIQTPTLEIKRCPECDEEVEIFSTDIKVKCSKCGFVIYHDIESCVQWCKYAEKCVGKEFFQRLKNKEKKDE